MRNDATTTSASSATSPSTRSTRRSPTASRTRWARVEIGKWADLVLWKPAFFGVKPSLILKGGFIAAAAMGDPNASIPTPQPVHYAADVRRVRRRAARRTLIELRQPGRRCADGVRRRATACASTIAAVKGVPQRHKQHMVHNAYAAEDGDRPADLQRARRRPVAHLRAGHGAADGAALLPVLGAAAATCARLGAVSNNLRNGSTSEPRLRGGAVAGGVLAGRDQQQRGRSSRA